MAAPTLEQIREGLKSNLAAISGVQVTAYRLANPAYPCVFVLGPEEVDYHETMASGTAGWMITVMALVGSVLDDGKQRQLDEFISPTGAKSVKVAIEADTTLGGIVDDLIVHKCSGYRVYGSEQSTLGAEWTVEIVTDGA